MKSGDKLIEFLSMSGDENNENLIIALDFPMGMSSKSKIDLLMNVNNFESYKTIYTINEKLKDLKDHKRSTYQNSPTPHPSPGHPCGCGHNICIRVLNKFFTNNSIKCP